MCGIVAEAPVAMNLAEIGEDALDATVTRKIKGTSQDRDMFGCRLLFEHSDDGPTLALG